MSLLLSLTRGYRWVLFIALTTSLISGFGNAGLVALINQALSASSQQLGVLGERFLLLGIVVLLTRTLSQTLFMYLGQRAKASLRMRTIERIGAASYRHLEQQGASKPLAVLTQDLDSIVVFFVNLPILAMQGAVVLGCLAYLGYLSWQIMILAVVTLIVGAVGFRAAHGKALFHLRGSRKREDELIRHFRGLFDGAKELKLHRERKRAFIDDTLATSVEAVRVQRTRGYVLYAAAASWGTFVLFAFVGITLFVLARLFPVDSHVMSGYSMTFLYMIMPVEGLLAALPTVSTARVALERIEQVNAELPLEDTRNDARPASFERIVLEGVTHRYFRESANEMFTLGPIDLSFTRGELVYLIGGNGSGKTTLAKMLVGLYVPDSGRILLDGETVDEAQRDTYRQLFSVVFNDFFLFDSLIGIGQNSGENSGENNAAQLDADARSLLEHLQLEHKVNIDNGKFSTLDLSQGQRKRLALLVAYLEDRPFYVFDEWAADQDPAFRDVFYRRLLPELKARGKTVLVITHDDRYFHLADRFIKLEYGAVIEQGSGAQLRNGRPFPASAA